MDIPMYLGMADRAYVIPRVGFRSRISLGSLSIHCVALTMNESKIETNMGFTKLLFNPWLRVQIKLFRIILKQNARTLANFETGVDYCCKNSLE